MEQQRAPISADTVTQRPALVTSPGDDTFALAEPGTLAVAGAEPPDEIDRAYIVIDDLDANVVVLVVSPWPTLDDLGRLRFDGESFQLAAEAEALYLTISAIRARDAGDLADLAATDRPLRVGDTFQVTNFRAATDVRTHLANLAVSADEDGTAVPAKVVFGGGDGFEWADVTAWARDATKLAFYTAVAPTLTEDEYRAVVSGDDPEATGAGT